MAVRRDRMMQEAALYTHAGMSIKKISGITGVSYFVVRRDLLDAGVTLRPQGRPRQLAAAVTMEE